MKYCKQSLTIALIATCCILLSALQPIIVSATEDDSNTVIDLPAATLDGDVSLEQAMYLRGSVRAYADTPLSLEDISQLVWAAQGVNEKGTRTAPSAGALYPMEVRLVVGEAERLEAGIYQYIPAEHQLNLVASGDFRTDLINISLGQQAIEDAPLTIVLSGVEERLTPRYGDRSNRYMLIETGHVAQNILLQVAALDLASVSIGSFNDQHVHELLQMGDNEAALYLLPVGHKAE